MIYVCSPYRGDVVKNVEFARFCCHKVVEKGLTPMAPHLYFTQFLDDGEPNERALGLKLALCWLDLCEEVWVFGSTISDGMAQEIAYAGRCGKPVKYFGT